MANYINTITIEPQEDASSLAAAMASALANALGWDLQDDGVTLFKTGTSLGFYFYVSSSTVRLSIANSTAVGNTAGAAVSYTADYYYYVDYVVTSSGTVAYGARRSDGSPGLYCMIAPNTAAEDVAIQVATNTAYLLRETDAAYKSHVLSTYVSTSGCGTSIVKYPDVFGSCMFKDVYYMMSCPYTGTTDKVFYIGGKYHRYAGSGSAYGGFALPVSS